MDQAPKSFMARWGTTFVGGPIAGGLGLFVSKAIDVWGVLDGPAKALGEFLKANVSGADLSLFAGFMLFAFLYAYLLRKVWGPREIHHVPLQAETAPAASLGIEHIPASTSPAPSPDPVGPHLTPGEKERCAATLQEVHDLLSAEVLPFLDDIEAARQTMEHAKGYALDLLAAVPSLCERQKALESRSADVMQRNSYYLGLMSLELEVVVRGIGELGAPLTKLDAAQDWPELAQRDRGQQVIQAYTQLNSDARAILGQIPAKRREYISG